MKHSGENWVERSPFDPEGYRLFDEEESVSPSNEDLTPEHDSNQPVELVELEAIPETGDETGDDIIAKGSELKLPAEGQSVDISISPPEEEEEKESPEVITRKVKVAKRRVILNVPSKEMKGEGEKGEEEEVEVVLRRKQPMRSKTVNYGPCSVGAGALRRQSLVMLKQGHTGEKGSRRFRAALRRDIRHPRRGYLWSYSQAGYLLLKYHPLIWSATACCV